LLLRVRVNPRYNSVLFGKASFFSDIGYVPTLGNHQRLDMTQSAFAEYRFRFATVSDQQVQWRLLKNCSVSPTQLATLYASLCIVSLGIASMFWFQGAKMIMPFAWLELMAVGTAFLVYARHATDGERLVLQDGQLMVEQSFAGKISRAAFDRERVRVEPHTDDRSLIELSGQGRRVQIGRHVRPELRSHLARELRMALRAG
jgi:uncharacterized membrane protein